MQSPPASPPQAIDLQGASRVTGGILRGRAYGNVFNMADTDIPSGTRLKPRKGRVQIYTTHVDPSVVDPCMEHTHDVTPKLSEILKSLSRKYSPIHSKTFSLYSYS